MEHTFSSIIHNLGGMLNNWSELGGLSAQRSFACSWWICGIQCTLQGERGNIVLSCVSVFTAHSLIHYSAGPSDCDPQFWEEGPSLLSLRWVCDSVSSPYCAALCAAASVLLHSVSHETHSQLLSEPLLCCSAAVACVSNITVTVFHLLKWVKVARLLMKWAAWPLQATLFFSCSSLVWGKRWKRRRRGEGVLLLESWGVPRLSVALSHRPSHECWVF